MVANDAIGKLNAGLRTFKEQTISDSSFDEHTKACIDVALVSFGPDVQVQQGFTAVSEMIPPTLTANGGTPMGAAIDKALDMIAEQKAKYNQYGTPYYRPWISASLMAVLMIPMQQPLNGLRKWRTQQRFSVIVLALQTLIGTQWQVFSILKESSNWII